MALTSSLKFWQRSADKDSFETVSDFDLFYQLTYMSAVAAAGISRNRIFHLASRLPRPPAAYFEKAALLSEKFSYDYATSCRTVGNSTKSDNKMKSLMLRLSGALTSGQPEAEFLAEEAQVQEELYEKQYERDLGSLSKWTDAYAAINVSATLIIIVNLVSMLIYDVGPAMTVGLVITAIFTASAGAWVLSRAAPREIRILFSPESPGYQALARKLLKLTPPAVLLICIPLLLIGVKLGLVLIIAALLIFPLGLVTMLAGRELDQKDREIGTFLRSLGGTAVSTGTTLGEALSRIELSSYPALKSDLERLRSRINAYIDPQLCWDTFAAETGSKLISEAVTIFNDAVKLGADPDTVAFLTAQFATKTNMLRAKRHVVASTLSWLTLIMHGTLATLLILILEVMNNFLGRIESAMSEGTGEAVQALTATMPVFANPPMEFLRWVTIGMVILLAVVNSFAIIATDGDHMLKLTFHLSILLAISGASLLFVPTLVNMIL